MAPGPLQGHRFRLTGVFLLVVGLGAAAALVSESDPESATLGAPAPNFTVPLLDGGSFDLATHLQTDRRPVILNLWASWCIPCRTETPELSAFAKDNPNIFLIGVAVMDTEEQARAFAEKFQPFHALAIGGQQFESRYQTLGLPATFFIDRRGTVVDIIFGIVDTNTLEQAFEG
ncbi:MAG: TlpA disulfide reductase family protein [Acidimicrobiia bacterium]|nr:TlpA disulfide reductase family protein [Acidimicrobiia bacterium]